MSNTMTRVMRKKVKVVSGKHLTEPTCDNCGLMTIITSGSGAHRHCDALGLYIPDWDNSATCPLHTRHLNASRELTKRPQKWETEEVTDPEEIEREKKNMIYVTRKEVCYE